MRKVFTVLFLFLAVKSFSIGSVSEAQALFIYNFSRFIQWPPNKTQGQFVIGVLASSDVASSLKKLMVGKKVGGQEIVITEFKTESELSTCHILFVGFSKAAKIQGIQQSLSEKGCLIISEKDDGLNNGAAIAFVIVENKLRFGINVDNATQQNLKISSNLLEMASK
ncbi:MAG: YfiR family protein [Bacteroidales bacterium]|nr:YfiR family protein [Bacteroidales bacterium]